MNKYNPREIEPKWIREWDKKPPYKAVDHDPRPKYYALVEFPYPSGEGLHIGHTFTNTMADILARKKRMDGFNVLHPMGWDAFGLPTENYAIKSGIHPSIITQKNTARFKEQDKSLGFSYNWEREINTTDPDYYRWTQWIFVQMFKHGLAYKKETPVGWCPNCKIILANEEIVGGKCERCGTEAEHRLQSQWLLEITRYADRLADELDLVDYPDYVRASQRNWIGRTEGVEIEYPVVGEDETSSSLRGMHQTVRPEAISCYSTRPDTNFGATFVVIAPEHPLVEKLTTEENKKAVQDYIEASRKKSELERTSLEKEKTGVFTGSYCLNRLTGKKMPIWVSDFVVLTAGTGIVVGVPAHDQRDWEFAKRYNLEIIPVIKPSSAEAASYAEVATKTEPARQEWDFEKGPFTDIDEAIVFNSDFLDGLPALEAKEKIIDYLVEKGWGKRAKNYHLRDWIFSRQHYWGEPIPMIYCPKCAEEGITWLETISPVRETQDTSASLRHSNSEGKQSQIEIATDLSGLRDDGNKHDELIGSGFAKGNLAGWFPVPESQLPVALPMVEKYEPTETGESPLAKKEDWVKVACPKCGGAARRETDTMPNWAGSSWYFLAYILSDRIENWELGIGNWKFQDIFSENQNVLAYWLPVDVYFGGAEHTTLHLLYSRFWHKFLNDLGVVPGKEPYAARRQHGVILGEDGFRMSKTRGNVLNPDEIAKAYGADAVRIYLMFMGPYDSTMPWETTGVEGCLRFLRRVWNLTLTKVGSSTSETLGRSLNKTIKKVGEDIENLKFNTAVAAMMELVNDWTSDKEGLSRADVRKFLLILAPFAPFMTEELWQRLEHFEVGSGKIDKEMRSEISGNQKNLTSNLKDSIHCQAWPKYDSSLVESEKVTLVIQINGKMRGKLELDPARASNQQEVEKLAREEERVKEHLSGKAAKKVIFVPGKLVNFVI